MKLPRHKPIALLRNIPKINTEKIHYLAYQLFSVLLLVFQGQKEKGTPLRFHECKKIYHFLLLCKCNTDSNPR